MVVLPRSMITIIEEGLSAPQNIMLLLSQFYCCYYYSQNILVNKNKLLTLVYRG